MNISPINFLKINNVKFTPQKNSIRLRGLNADSVSFSSNYLKSSQHIEDAVDLGYQIYFNSLQKSSFSPQKFLARKEKNVQILSTGELRKERADAENYCAYFSCEYDDDILPTDMKLYIGDKPKSSNSMVRLTHAMEIAHEYTHLKQTTDNSDAEFLKELCNGDKEYLLLLNGLGRAVFSIFDTYIQAELVTKTFDLAKIQNFLLQTGKIMPHIKETDKEQFLKINGFGNQDSFNLFFKRIFDEIFDSMFEKINNNTVDIEPRVKDAFMSFLAKEGSLTQLRKDVKKYCAYIAQAEYEAYTTESKLAKKVMRTDSSLNIDSFPIYYNLLHDALNN